MPIIINAAVQPVRYRYRTIGRRCTHSHTGGQCTASPRKVTASRSGSTSSTIGGADTNQAIAKPS